MKSVLHIAAIVDQPQLLKDLVEKLVIRRTDAGEGSQRVLPEWRVVDAASTETYTSGTVMLDDDNAHIALPFITSFLFSCLKDSEGAYKIEWSSSLS